MKTTHHSVYVGMLYVYVTDTMGAVFSLVLSLKYYLFCILLGTSGQKGISILKVYLLGFSVVESITLRSLLSIPVAFAKSAISNSCLICYLQ